MHTRSGVRTCQVCAGMRGGKSTVPWIRSRDSSNAAGEKHAFIGLLCSGCCPSPPECQSGLQCLRHAFAWRRGSALRSRKKLVKRMGEEENSAINTPGSTRGTRP